MKYNWKTAVQTVTYSGADIAGGPFFELLEDRRRWAQHDLMLVVFPDEPHDRLKCVYCDRKDAAIFPLLTGRWGED